MKVNPSQSQSIWSEHGVGKVKSSSSSDSADKISSSNGISPSMEGDSFSSSDAAKMQETVKELMQQSAIRPEVVDSYDKSEPVKAFDEETLRRFINALSEEP